MNLTLKFVDNLFALCNNNVTGNVTGKDTETIKHF